jgi:serine/threonine-protein phosphatase PGAM5
MRARLRQIRIHLLLPVLLALLARTAIAAEAPARPTGIHYVCLIRHGHYDRDSTASDEVGNGLNALGRTQARLIGSRLAALPIRPASLVTSTFRRASETADVIGGILEMTPARDSLIHECTPSSTREDPMRKPEGTALCDSNLAAAWAKYMTPSPAADRTDVLVCHGNVIRAFVCRAVTGDSRHWRAMEIGNASLTILAVRPDGTTRLVMFSDVGHLPVDQQSWTGKGAGWGAKPPR